jgi:hypothetical protein
MYQKDTIIKMVYVDIKLDNYINGIQYYTEINTHTYGKCIIHKIAVYSIEKEKSF